VSFKDHFSGHAGSYARYRPEYPPALFEYLATLTPRHDYALDCATGSGQAALGLAAHFDTVLASDGSVAQLKHSYRHPRVVYLANLAEQPALKDRSVDLVVAAQAAHWFDHERFYPEVRRVLRPAGALAIWTYGFSSVSPDIDPIVEHFYSQVVGKYWPPERRYVESGYRTMPFAVTEIAAPTLQLEMQWDMDAYLGYIGTWSAVQRCTKETGDPLPELRAQVARYWNPATELKAVVWPIHIRVGR
jgi:ubiquinone/menaquinone biosynthesis C-methylase UbiE